MPKVLNPLFDAILAHFDTINAAVSLVRGLFTNTLLKLSIITGSGLSEGEWSLKQPMGFTDGSDVVPQRREKARSALRCIVTTESIADQNDCVALNADPHTAVAVFQNIKGPLVLNITSILAETEEHLPSTWPVVI